MTAASFRYGHIGELDSVTFHALIKLRIEVFVVEQKNPIPELDGRDVEPGTLHLWAERDQAVLSCLRLVRAPDGSARIDRLCTGFGARGQGLAGRLVGHAIRMTEGPISIDVPAQLEEWCARFGFVRGDEPYTVDGVPHLALRR